jgi:hypothetical protein
MSKHVLNTRLTGALRAGDRERVGSRASAPKALAGRASKVIVGWSLVRVSEAVPSSTPGANA